MRPIVALPVLVVVVLGAGACSARAGSSAGGAGTPTTGSSASASSPSVSSPSASVPSASVPSASAPGSAGAGDPSAVCRSGRVSVSELDSGHDLCVTVGTLVEVYLHGSPDARWTTVTSDSPALRPVANGRGSVPLGVTAGFFQATAASTAHLTASRPACPSATPGAAACTARTAFTLTVRER